MVDAWVVTNVDGRRKGRMNGRRDRKPDPPKAGWTKMENEGKHPEDADETANCVDLDQALLFVQTYVQWTFSGSNNDGSLTITVSNSFLHPLDKNPIAADLG